MKYYIRKWFNDDGSLLQENLMRSGNYKDHSFLTIVAVRRPKFSNSWIRGYKSMHLVHKKDQDKYIPATDTEVTAIILSMKELIS